MSDRDCKHCKHLKPDGCSRWDCEYEPVMSDLIKKSDAIKALYKYGFVSKNVIEREINAIPSADAVDVVRCKDCEYGQYDCTHMYCDYFCHKVYDTDYCSNAVRRSNAVKRREP